MSTFLLNHYELCHSIQILFKIIYKFIESQMINIFIESWINEAADRDENDEGDEKSEEDDFCLNYFSVPCFWKEKLYNFYNLIEIFKWILCAFP